MSLWSRISGEFIDIIEWMDDTRDTMVFRFERHQNEIKYGAKLIVREGQAAVLINEGKLADVFNPGTYTLETKNLPILSTLQGWKYGFESPFKAEVYFVTTRQFTELKWGTQNPVMVRDPEFGPVRLRAFGTYAMRIQNASQFLTEVVGTDSNFGTEEITQQLRNIVVSRFTNLIGTAKIPVLDMAGNYDQLGEFLTKRLAPEFEQYGLLLTKMLVENISLPPEVEEVLDKRTSMGVVGNLNAYMQFQTANSIPDMAQQPGGLAGGAFGAGVGWQMANQMGQAFQQPTPAMSPPPVPNVSFHVAVNGQSTGPYDLQTLQQQVLSGHLKTFSLVWRQGMTGWEPAENVAELAALFAQLPPPVPPPAP
ncbi:MAG TPA: SPFH domain-containing protein [Rhodothermales bacterium]|nr:SPFH domain-containing protein [Rhodothermales bacterium]